MDRTPYMQLVVEFTYAPAIVEGILTGNLTKAWEKAIADRLEKDWHRGNTLPKATLDYLGISASPAEKQTWLNAAKLVLKTEIPNNTHI